MKTFEKLESLGFFDWLSETHNLRDTDMKPEYLDELPLNDIHRTVVNSMVFRWFRDEYELFGSSDISNFENKTYGYIINSLKSPHYLHNVKNFKSMEEAELACLDKLLEIVESKQKEDGKLGKIKQRI